jgi:hypothetical protein
MRKILLIFGVLVAVLTCFAGFPAVTSGVIPSTAQLPVPPMGELYSVSLSTTLQGLQACLRGDFGTGIFSNPARPDSLIFMWRASENAFAFVGLNLDPKTMVKDLMGLRANYSNFGDYKGIINALQDTGWTSISYKFVEGTVRNPILMGTINRILAGMTDRFTTFVFMPLGVNPGQIGLMDYAKISDADSRQ